MALRAPSAAEHESPGILASLRRLGSTLLATLHSRAELLGYELERERARVTRLVVLGVVAFFFLLLGAIAATIFFVLLFWESQRLVVLGFLTLLYLAIAGGIFVYIKREAGRAKRPFSSTLEQLQKDREHFARHRGTA
ncbi:MAG TPA: phage holin family protein [Burkholderiales bacterium]|nr:phage holin family protein [Burkholderiales bacterium]